MCTFCFDNIDINEETLSGYGTTHTVNGIIVQPKVPTCLTKPSPAKRMKVTTRSIQPQNTQILPFTLGKRPSPGHLSTVDLAKSMSHSIDAMQADTLWFLTRFVHGENLDGSTDSEQVVPGWTAFNAMMTSNNVPPQSNIGYLPMIDGSATQHNTVYTLLSQAVTMAKELNLQDAIIVVDQAIYAKAVDIVWKEKEVFKNVVLRLGAFHTSMTFMSVIGKRFADAGLLELLVNSCIVAPASAAAVLDGKHYNRSIRAHKLIVEALLRVRWAAFVEWLQTKPFTGIDTTRLTSDIRQVRQTLHLDDILVVANSVSFKGICSLYDQFCQTPNGPMAEYWNSYIGMVQLLLRFIRSTKEGNWQLHFECIRQMAPWMFAYDRTNYSRYLPLYWCEMMALPRTHPQAYQHLNSGEFGSQRSKSNGFSKTPIDKTIEETINKATKTKGRGIIGKSLNKGAVLKWTTTSHERAAIMTSCRIAAGKYPYK